MTTCGVVWGLVHHKMDTVAIFGTGPSLRGVRLEIPAGITTVGVGGTLGHVPLDFWFTADCSTLNRSRMASASHYRGTAFYAAVDEFYGTMAASKVYLRAAAELGVTYLHRPKKRGLSTNLGAVHGGNSAFGALGFVFLGGARRIGLFGVDGQQASGYAWDHGKPRNLSNMPGLFESAIPQLMEAGVEVVVGSSQSALSFWPRMTPEEAMGWLTASIIEPGGHMAQVTIRNKAGDTQRVDAAEFAKERAVLAAAGWEEWTPEDPASAVEPVKEAPQPRYAGDVPAGIARPLQPGKRR